MANRCVFQLVACVIVASPAVADDDGQWPVDLNTAFVQTSRLDGPAYCMARRYLMQQPDELVKVLRQHVNGADWRRRDLSRALLLRVEEPRQVEIWDSMTLGSRKKTLELLPDGNLKVHFPADSNPVTGSAVPETGIVVDRRSSPWLLEKLREIGPDAGGSNKVRLDTLLTMLMHFADPDCAEAVADCFFRDGLQHDALLDDLPAAFRGQTAASLREALKSAPVERQRRSTSGQYRMVRLAIRSARLLGRIEDHQAIPLLLSRLEAAPTGELALACAQSLAAMGQQTALPPTFDHLVRLSELGPGVKGTSCFEASYLDFRNAVLGFGEPLRPYLVKMSAAEQPAAPRVVAAGLLFEIDHPLRMKAHYQALAVADISAQQAAGSPLRDAKDLDLVELGRQQCWRPYRRGYGSPIVTTEFLHPWPVLLERAVAFAEPEDLRQAARQPEAVSAEVAGAGLLSRRLADADAASIALALASAGHEQAIDVFRQLLARERASPLSRALVEAMLLLGSPQAIPLLESMNQRRADQGEEQSGEAAQLAEAVLRVLRGKGRGLTELLEHPSPSVRLAAARRLASAGDAKALPELLKAAVGATSRDFDDLASVIVQLGAAAVESLTETQRVTKDDRERLLCEAILLSIRRPRLMAQIARASTIRTPGFGAHFGPGLKDYRAAGDRVAEFLGVEAVPLLEAALVFDAYGMNRGIGAFALAKLRQPRSIPAVVRSLRQPVFARGVAVSAEALKEFGEAGIQAAKSVPRPDPRRAEYGRRASRSRLGARVLVDAGETQGVEEVLTAIEKVYQPDEQPPGESYRAWQQRTAQYLGIAAKIEDQRLIEPLLRYARHRDGGLAEPAFRALLPYEDDRIAAAAMTALCHEMQPGGDYALQNLVRLRGVPAVQQMAEQLEHAMLDEARSILKAIHQLTRDAGLWVRKPMDPEADGRLAAARHIVKSPLIQKLVCEDPVQQTAAADALATFDPTDAEISAALASWLQRRARIPNSEGVHFLVVHAQVVDCLARSGRDDAASALLAAYRAGGQHDGHLASTLGRMKFPPAFEDLCIGLDKRLAQPPSRTNAAEIGALAEFGERGLRELQATLRGAGSLHLRSCAAEALAAHRFQPAFDDIRDLLLNVADQELEHPGIAAVAETERRPAHLSAALHRLANSLGNLDSARASPVLVQAIFKLEQPELIRLVAGCAQQFGIDAERQSHESASR